MESVRCARPIRRRELLQAGLLALGGVGLADVLAGQAASGTERRDRAVILLYLHGGASQLETWDLKPDAPAEYRSVFRPIASNVPGLDLCEHFPLQARIAERFSLLRGMHHDVGIHSDGGIVALTGKFPSRPDPTSQSVSEHPDFGSIASRSRGPHPEGMPPYVALPRKPYMTRPAYLGLQHGPFEPGDPSAADYRPPHQAVSVGTDARGLDDRRGLLAQLDRLRSDLDLRGDLRGTDEFRDRAWDMLASPRTAAAFDIAREEARLRDRYGRHRWGQSCLLARRLAEAGTSVVTVWIDAAATGDEHTNWDDHAGNAGRPGHFAGYMERRLPYFDQALTALIEDLGERGLDERILVVATTEFGRTPRLRRGPPDGSIGRDHWPNAYTALVAGGGLRMGQVVGATNSKAEFPTARPCTPQDLLATIYRHLGIDPAHAFVDFAGRPIPILGEGRPIVELIGG